MILENWIQGNNQKSVEETYEIKSSKIVSGEYLENISIKTENNDYIITANIGQKPLQVSSIRITAENECPFKKQIFQQDFQYNSGAEVSFSFYQLSQSKPSECSIHFTISNFDGQVLETIIVDYNFEKPTTTSTTETTSSESNLDSYNVESSSNNFNDEVLLLDKNEVVTKVKQSLEKIG